MNSITTLTLDTPQGPFEFDGAEVPEQISFGGKQMLNVQKMIGGLRIIDAAGPDDASLSWSGIFLYNSASDRARFLDFVRRSGFVCTLSWGDFRYQVIVSEFKADFKKPFHIPFTITCEIVEDEVSSIDYIVPVTPAEAIQQDSARMSQLSDAIGDPTISDLTSSVSSGLSSVTDAAQPIANGLVALTSAAESAASSFSQVIGGVANTVSEISSTVRGAVAAVTAPLAALTAGVSSAIATAEATVASIPIIGGIGIGIPIAKQVSGLISQAAAAVHLPMLYELSSITKRLQVNVALVANPIGINQVVTGGGNLYQIASQKLGDATRWPEIAQASGITDPMMTGFNTITVPA